MSDATAAVIATANTKGGCGKSTTILILAGEYASQGYRVHIIDTDPKRRLAKWGEAGVKPERITVSQATSANISDELQRARGACDVVLIDVEGSANAALALAVASADLVIIPANISPPDVEDAFATVKLVRDMGRASRREIPFGVLWSSVPAAIRSREMMNLERQVAQSGLPILGRIFERTAFAAMFSFQTTIDNLPALEVSGREKAKADAVRLTLAIDAVINPAAEVA